MHSFLVRRSLIAALAVASFGPVGLGAEQFFGVGLGLMSNLADVGGTITKDGVDSLRGTPSMLGGKYGTGCEQAGDRTACLREQPGAYQRIIIPERVLRDYESNTAGAIRSKTTKSMFGLDLTLMYEREMDWAFLRIDAAYTARIYGGRSSSKVIGIKWYESNWDYKRWNVPVFFGVKAKVGEKTAIYIAPGISYVRGTVTVGIRNLGDIPTTLLGGSGTVFGTTTTINAAGVTTGGSILNEHATFKTSGPGLNFLIGAEAKLASGARFFVEMHRVIAGDHASVGADDLGTQVHLARVATLPINLSGTVFRAGIKWGL